MARVALFGCGWIQDFHARGVLEHGDEIVAVANHREETARAFAERHGIPRVTTDWEALAADPYVEAAVVSTPNALHAPQSAALLRNGKHVMVEKPMATSVAGCDEMIAASREGDAFLMVAHCWRFRDEVRAMRARIAAGELGEIVKTHGYGVHAGWGPSGWFTDPSSRAGRARRHGRARHRHRPVLLGDRHPAACARRSAPGTRRPLHRRRRRRRHDRVGQRDEQRRGVGGGTRTWADWKPTPRSTGRRVRADLAGGGSVGRLRALHAADVQRRSPSSWMRSVKDVSPARPARTAAW